MAATLTRVNRTDLIIHVENRAFAFRVRYLEETGAKVKFLSLEPLLKPLPALGLHGIDWVIVGGESGPGARSMAEEWVVDIRDQCVAAGVPFFFKQWGGVRKKQTGRILGGVPGINGRRWPGLGSISLETRQGPRPAVRQMRNQDPGGFCRLEGGRVRCWLPNDRGAPPPLGRIPGRRSARYATR